MEPDVLAQVATIIVMMAGSLAAIGVATVFLVRRTSRLPHPRQDDERLEHLQQSVDAIAIEVERIAEAQRFSAKLLAERAEDVPDSERGARIEELRRSVKG